MSHPYPLGRIPQFDPKSLNFPVRRLLGDQWLPLRSYSWSPRINLDQEREGACVGFTIAHEWAARPKVVRGVTNQVGLRVYRRAQDLDGMPWTDGTSVLAGMKAGVEFGFYGSYWWAQNEAELARSVGYHGPAVIGVNWMEGMWEPDEDGFLHASGQVVGGHCTLVYGISLRLGAYRIWNSWGPGWGHGGTALISREDMSLLLRSGGEAAIPVRTNKREVDW